jgi:hypothetical protein
MSQSAAEMFRAWHDFYIFLGTVAATLIGAMFVVASIGAGFLTRAHGPQIRTFLTPTVIHLASIVLASAAALVPTLTWPSLSVAFGIGGAGGMAYSALVGWRVARTNVDGGDRVWYALIPLIGYAIVLASALSVVFHAAPDFAALAVGLVLLLVASVRNAWDMIVFFASRDRDPQ